MTAQYLLITYPIGVRQFRLWESATGLTAVEVQQQHWIRCPDPGIASYIRLRFPTNIDSEIWTSRKDGNLFVALVEWIPIEIQTYYEIIMSATRISPQQNIPFIQREASHL